MKENILKVLNERARRYGTLHGIMIAREEKKEAQYYSDMWNGVLSIILDFQEYGMLTEEDLKIIEDKYISASRRAAGGKL